MSDSYYKYIYTNIYIDHRDLPIASIMTLPNHPLLSDPLSQRPLKN